jgi:lipopolysaccharide transport system permease protein
MLTQVATTSPSPVIIRPRSGWGLPSAAELWAYRDLLGMLALRDISVRYKQTFLGVSWAVLQPVATMLIFAIFFGHLGGLSRHVPDGTPYFIYTFCALLPWQLFAHALTAAGNSLIENQNLVTKVYFPRVIVPLSAVLVGLVDFAVALLVLVAMMAWCGIWPGLPMLSVPLFTLVAVLTALAVGIWLAALNTLYRDFRYTIPFLTQIWLFASPVAYPASIVPDRWGLPLIYSLNPMVGVIEGFRWAMLGVGEPPGPMAAVSIAATAVMLWTGLIYFRRVERILADRI